MVCFLCANAGVPPAVPMKCRKVEGPDPHSRHAKPEPNTAPPPVLTAPSLPPNAGTKECPRPGKDFFIKPCTLKSFCKKPTVSLGARTRAAHSHKSQPFTPSLAALKLGSKAPCAQNPEPRPLLKVPPRTASAETLKKQNSQLSLVRVP